MTNESIQEEYCICVLRLFFSFSLVSDSSLTNVVIWFFFEKKKKRRYFSSLSLSLSRLLFYIFTNHKNKLFVEWLFLYLLNINRSSWKEKKSRT